MAKKAKWLDVKVAKSPHLILCLTKKDAKRAGKILNSKVDFPSSGANCTAFDSSIGAPVCCVVCLSKSAQDCEIAGIHALLVHEYVHVWQHLREDIGEKIPGVEQEAYAIQGIAESLFNEYSRRVNDLED